jgi:hypothetical protein
MLQQARVPELSRWISFLCDYKHNAVGALFCGTPVFSQGTTNSSAKVCFFPGRVLGVFHPAVARRIRMRKVGTGFCHHHLLCATALAHRYSGIGIRDTRNSEQRFGSRTNEIAVFEEKFNTKGQISRHF